MKNSFFRPSLCHSAAALLVTLAAPHAHAAFTFTNIVDSATPAPNGNYFSFRDAAVSGNNVAFKAKYQINSFIGNADGVYSGAGGPISLAMRTLAPGPSIDGASTTVDAIGPPSIYQNSIAFWAHYSSFFPSREGHAVFSSTGVGWRVEVDYRQNHLLVIESPVITGVGTYFLGNQTGFDPSAVYLRGMNRFAGLGDAVSPSGTLTALGIQLSASGTTVAFPGAVDSQQGVFRSGSTGTTAIALVGDAAPSGGVFTALQPPAVSGETVAFRATTSASAGIFTGAGGPLTTIAKVGDPAPGGGAFASFSDPATSACAVAFHATLDSGQGVFQSQNGATTKVLKTGDLLFGSPVTSLAFSARGLDPDGAGTLAIIYGLADGRTGVALATPGAAESADFDDSHYVDAADLAAWTEHFGAYADATHAQGDADFDFDVDAGDFLLWQSHFAPPPSNHDMASVPEPDGAWLAVIAALALLVVTGPGTAANGKVGTAA